MLNVKNSLWIMLSVSILLFTGCETSVESSEYTPIKYVDNDITSSFDDCLTFDERTAILYEMYGYVDQAQLEAQLKEEFYGSILLDEFIIEVLMGGEPVNVFVQEILRENGEIYAINWVLGPGAFIPGVRREGLEESIKLCREHVLLFHSFDIFTESGIINIDTLNEWLLPLREQERYSGGCVASLLTFVEYFDISKEVFQEFINSDIEWYARFGGDTLDVLYSGDMSLIDEFFCFENGRRISQAVNERRNNPFSELTASIFVPWEDLPVIIASIDPLANFTSTWARTDNYFFFPYERRWVSKYDNDGFPLEWSIEHILYRLPLSDIAQGESIQVPGDGQIHIVGVNEQYLFISRSGDSWPVWGNETYQISLSTWEAAHINSDAGTYHGVPFYHASSNSIIFVRRIFEEGESPWADGLTVQFEALNLNTGERHTFFEYRPGRFSQDNMAWQQA